MDNFNEAVFREIDYKPKNKKSNVIKSGDFQIIGSTKISIEEETHEGVRIILNKDENDNIKEIKFVCSCGETKSVILDYSD